MKTSSSTPSKLVLLSERKEDLVFSQSLSQRCGLELRSEKKLLSQKKIIELLMSGAHVLIDSGLPKCLDILAGIQNDKNAFNKIHFIVDTRDKHILNELFTTKNLVNILFRCYEQPELGAESYSPIIKSLDLPDVHGLEIFLGPNSEIEKIRFDDSLAKGFISNTVQFQLNQFGINELIIPFISSAADELIMNAIYNAPVDNHGRRKHNQESMKASFKLEGRDVVEMQFAISEKGIAISVVDLYGSLSPEAVWPHIARGFEDDRADLGDSKDTGAGIGLARIIRSGGSLYFACKPGKRTEAMVFYRRTETRKEFTHQFQSITVRLL